MVYKQIATKKGSKSFTLAKGASLLLITAFRETERTIMRTVVFLTLAIVCAVSASNSLNNAPNVVHAESGPDAESYVRSLIELRDFLGLSEEFTLREESSRKSSSGVERVRLRQEFNGLPIRVATLQASKNGNGFFTGSVSGLCPSIPRDFNTSASNSVRQLKTRLIDFITSTDGEIPEGRTLRNGMLKNFQREKQIHINVDDGTPTVVYFVSALVDIGLRDGAYIRYPRAVFKAGGLEVISASLPVQKDYCGDRVKSCPKAHGGNGKDGGLSYGPKRDQVCLNASFKNNKCVLDNNFVNVKTVKNTWRRRNAEVVSFDCETGPDDGINESASPAADAYFYAQIFYDVLHYWGRLDRTHREPHTLYVHFGDNYPNSFWDGESTTFGDGADRTYSYATPEIIGHEMCHAVTDSFGNLIFNKQSDAVGEAFADICGKAVNYYMNGNKAGWRFADALLVNADKALRYFDDPTLDGSTISSYNDYTSDTDGYVGMGIYLKAFYSIVELENVRFRDAFEAFVFANQIYWNEETGLVDGACGVLRAAQDLGLDAEAFRRGFAKVDIGLTDSGCSLKGSQDPIVYCEESSGGEVRHAEINSYRQARYLVKAAAGKSTINASASCHGHSTVDIKSVCADGTLLTHGSSASIPLAGDTEVIVTAHGEDLVGVTVRFDYE